jgi:putative transposase
MGTRTHPDSEGLPYFVTFTTHERRPLFRDAWAARLFVEHLEQVRNELGFLLVAYAVMPDHVHLIVVPGPRVTLAKLMQIVKGRFARSYNQRTGHQGKLWQPRYYETAVRGETALMRRMEYIEANPIVAGLVKSAEEYEFSSAGRPTDLTRYLGGEPTPPTPG